MNYEIKFVEQTKEQREETLKNFNVKFSFMAENEVVYQCLLQDLDIENVIKLTQKSTNENKRISTVYELIAK